MKVAKPIRVLVADDSPTARALIVALLESSADFTVVGDVQNGAEAIERAIALSPDLVIMDVHMPIVDGLDATKEIMREAPSPILMVSASSSMTDVGLGLSATQAGALALLQKPKGPGSPDAEDEARQFLAMAKAMSAVKVVRRWSKAGRRIVVERSATANEAVRLVAIGTSTGGPAALHRILIDLPSDLGVPVVVVQHMARGFIDGLAKWLGANVALPVKVAAEGETLIGGTVYIAPDDYHLGVSSDGRVRLATAAPLSGFRPSVDYLFDSCARAYGGALVAAILTGMGQDGVEGLVTVKARGGRVIAQDAASSVVFGMAQQAVQRGLVDEVLPLDRIGKRIQSLVEGNAS